MDISFDCDKCGKHLIIDEAAAGITIDCPNCGKPVYVPSLATQGATAPEIPPDQPTRVEVKSAKPKAPPVSPPKVSSAPIERRTSGSPLILVSKYKALRAIANFCQFMAIPSAIVQVLIAFLIFRFGMPYFGPVAVIWAVIIVIVGLFNIIALLAAAESIRVFIDIEENTRAVKQMMEHEFRIKYHAPSPTTEASRVSAEIPNQSPQSSSQVRFGGTTSG